MNGLVAQLVRLLVAVLIGAALAVVYFKATETAPTGVPTEAAAAAPVAKVEKDRIDCAPVQAYKAPAKAKLKLSKAVQEDSSKVVLAATEVKADIRPHVIADVLDTKTGEVDTYDTRQEAPWLGVTRRGRAGGFYDPFNRKARLFVEQSVATVKDFQIGFQASYDFPVGGGAIGFKSSGLIGIGGFKEW
jgi:hypothetical protein